MPHAERRAFTVIELLLALALSGVVLAGAATLLASLSAASRRLVVVGDAHGLGTIGESRLARLLRNVIAPRDSGTASLRGDDSTAGVETWCTTQRGWRARCRVRFAVRTAGVGSELVAAFSTGESTVVWREPSQAGLRYFDPAEGAWRFDWSDSAKLPAALAIVGRGDTTIVPIGIAYE